MKPELKYQSGVMLLEALIAILIFSIGILTLIGMQATAIKNTADARYRSEAATLAQQIIGQMWLDRANLGSYDDASGSNYVPRTTWRTAVESTLPGIDIAGAKRVPSITVDVASNNEVTVIVYWLQPGAAQDPGCAPNCSNKFQMINRINGPL